MERTQQCECGSYDVRYDPNHGFYECLSCENVWSYPEDDPDYDECVEEVDYGTCCACGTTGPTVRNLLMLSKKAPVAGTGWGCVVCALPSDGAIAVVCDSCVEAQRPLEQAVYGFFMEKGRIPFNSLTEEFKHKDVPHKQKLTKIEEEFRALGYVPPFMTPLHWRDEKSGRLPSAVSAYIYHAGGRTRKPTQDELLLVRNYLKYWIMAPCWKAEEGEHWLDRLRERSHSLNTAAEISNWLDDCLEMGLDPL